MLTYPTAFWLFQIFEFWSLKTTLFSYRVTYFSQPVLQLHLFLPSLRALLGGLLLVLNLMTHNQDFELLFTIFALPMLSGVIQYRLSILFRHFSGFTIFSSISNLSFSSLIDSVLMPNTAKMKLFKNFILS